MDRSSALTIAICFATMYICKTRVIFLFLLFLYVNFFGVLFALWISNNFFSLQNFIKSRWFYNIWKISEKRNKILNINTHFRKLKSESIHLINKFEMSMHLLDALKQSRSQQNAVKFRGLNANISSIWHRNKNDVCVCTIATTRSATAKRIEWTNYKSSCVFAWIWWIR